MGNLRQERSWIFGERMKMTLVYAVRSGLEVDLIQRLTLNRFLRLCGNLRQGLKEEEKRKEYIFHSL
jgi:hypothetical protein